MQEGTQPCPRGHRSSGVVPAAPGTPAAAWGWSHLLLLLLHREQSPATFFILLLLNPSCISKAALLRAPCPGRDAQHQAGFSSDIPMDAEGRAGTSSPPGPLAPRAGPASRSIAPRGCSGGSFHLSSPVVSIQSPIYKQGSRGRQLPPGLALCRKGSLGNVR